MYLFTFITSRFRYTDFLKTHLDHAKGKAVLSIIKAQWVIWQKGLEIFPVICIFLKDSLKLFHIEESEYDGSLFILLSALMS